MEKELKFQPVTEGLGFHPFSDGMPYAPVKSPASTRGAGAVAAGPPRMAQITKPKAPAQSLPALAQKPPVVAATVFEVHYGFVYMMKRVFAFTLDTAFNLSLAVGALSTALWRQDLNPEVLLGPGVVLIAALFLAFFNWALITAEEVAFGTTVGKRIFGLALQGSASAVFLRAFFFLPSLGFCGLGILWAIFDGKRRCVHDLVVDLQPIEIARL